MKTTPFDFADYLTTPGIISAYLEEAFNDPDPRLFMLALGNVARAKGMNDIAKATGLGRQSLYKTRNGDTVPKFDTIKKILGALDIKMVLSPARDKPEAAA